MADDIRKSLLGDGQTVIKVEELENSETENSDGGLVRSKAPIPSNIDKRFKKKSAIWNFFEKINHNIARCEFCERGFSYHSTSNLAKHLARKHPIVHRNFENNKIRIKKNDSNKNSENSPKVKKRYGSRNSITPKHTKEARRNTVPTNNSLSECSTSEEASSSGEEEDSNTIVIQDARSITNFASEETSKSSNNTSMQENNDKNESSVAAEDMQTTDVKKTLLYQRLLNVEGNSTIPAGSQKADFPKLKQFSKSLSKPESFKRKKVKCSQAMDIGDKLGRFLHSNNSLEEKQNQVISDEKKMILDSIQVLNSNLVNMTNAVLNLCKVGEKIAENLSMSNSCKKCQSAD